MLSILLLGLPQILRAGVAVELPRRRARALVFYLATQARPVSREQLLGLLWPDHERSAAQQILRTTLSAVRRALGSALVANDQQLALAAEVDYRVLAALVAAPDADEQALATVLARPHDELLAGFELPDAEPFAEWLLAERERARLLVVRGLTRLAQLAEARADYQAAGDALGAALGLAPLQEDLQRAAIRLHYLAGDRVGAIRRYEQLRELLDAELGVPPMQATRELYDAIITDSLPAGPVQEGRRVREQEGVVSIHTLIPSDPRRAQQASGLPPPGYLPFTGRASELEQLDEATRAGRLALIEGEAGIGKTRLGEEFLARHQGLALQSAARELEQSLPYQPIVGALRGLLARPDWPALRASLALDPLWLHEAARLLPELGGADERPAPTGRPEEARLWEGVARLLLALAQLHPLALLLDDLQWADASTLGLLGYLLRRTAGAPLRLLATTRPAALHTPLAALLAALTREGRLERLPLHRLSDEETAALARGLSPHYAPPLANWLQRNAEGNPYMIVELVEHARSSGLLLADGTLNLSALSASPVVPQTIYSLIAMRLAGLSEGARRVLDAAVAAGREFEFAVAARAAALSETAALDALDELRAARLVEPLPDGRYRFDHSLTMEVAYREVGEPRHRMLHRRLAEALESLHGDRLDAEAGLVASHFAEGGAPERAAAYAQRAGHQAASVAAWAEAAAFFTQALAGAPPTERHAVLMALGEALLNQGQSVQASQRFREALASAHTPAEALQARRSLGQALVPQGRYGEVIALGRELADSAMPAERIAGLFLLGTVLSLEGADLAEAALRLREAERMLTDQTAPDQIALAQIRFELGSVAAQQGDLPRAVAYYHEAMAVADGVATLDGALDWRVLTRNNLAYHLHLLGDLNEATRYAAEGVRLAEERGVLSMQPYLHSTSGEIALARGQLDEAEHNFVVGLALAERFVIPERVAGLQANLGLVAERRGQHDLARQRLSAALARADALGTRHLAAQIRVWLAPLLAAPEAQAMLAGARTIAESGERRRLLAEIAQAEQAIGSKQ